MQGKECKHSELKQELKSGTNRSTACDQEGKWYQIMRNSYVRTFYLPYHFPISALATIHIIHPDYLLIRMTRRAIAPE